MVQSSHLSTQLTSGALVQLSTMLLLVRYPSNHLMAGRTGKLCEQLLHLEVGGIFGSDCLPKKYKKDLNHIFKQTS